MCELGFGVRGLNVSRTIYFVLASLLAACNTANTVIPESRGALKPLARPAPLQPASDALVSKTKPLSPEAAAAPLMSQFALQGRVKLPDTLLSKTKPLISDRAGGLISNNGAGLVSNNGGNLQGDPAGALRQLQQTAQDAPVVGAVVRLEDASGRPLRDAAGNPLQTTTDPEGRYAFQETPGVKAYTAVCELPNNAGELLSVVPQNVTQADITFGSTLFAHYVLARYAQTQADPQAALERLPAELDAQARQATERASAGSEVLEQLEATQAIARVEELREQLSEMDSLYEEVRRAMVLAGQFDQGAGELATAASFNYLTAYTVGADGSQWLYDNFARRLWRVADGRLQSAAGLGKGKKAKGGVPFSGDDPALDVNLPGLVSLGFDADNRPLLLFKNQLCRLEASGRLKRIWQDETREAREVIRLPAGDIVILTKTGLVPLGQAALPPLPPPAEARKKGLKHCVVKSDGTCFYVTVDGTGRWAWWRGTLTTLPEEISVPENLRPIGPKFPDYRRWLGLDDGGRLITLDGKGALSILSPDAQIQAYSAEVTAQWPETIALASREIYDEAGVFKRYRPPSVRVGGDATTGLWLMRRRAVFRLDGGGTLTRVAGGASALTAADGNDFSGLQRPLAVAALSPEQLVIVEPGRRALVQSVARQVSRFAGVSWRERPQVVAHALPFGFSLTWRGAAGSLENFGADYNVSALEARFLGPERLRVAPDGALWVLDRRSFLRRIQNGQVTTLKVPTASQVGSPAPARWLDMWPTSATDGVILVSAPDALELRMLSQLGAAAPLAVFPRDGQSVSVEGEAEDDQEGADDDFEDVFADYQFDHHPWDALAPLPEGAYLVRAYGVTWRWQPGGTPQRLSKKLNDELPDSDELNGGRLVADDKGHVAFIARRHVYSVDPLTGAYTRVAGQMTDFLSGEGVDDGLLWLKGGCVSPSGDLLVVDYAARQVKRIPAAVWQIDPS